MTWIRKHWRVLVGVAGVKAFIVGQFLHDPTAQAVCGTIAGLALVVGWWNRV